MKRFSLVVSSLFVFLFLALTARAGTIPITDLYVNPSAVAPGSPEVGPFTTFAFHDQTRSIADATTVSDITVGTSFLDFGHGMVYELRDENNRTLSAPGLDEDWTFWVEWDIASQVDSITGNIYNLSYSYGSLTVWLTSADGSFGTEQSPEDDVKPSNAVFVLNATIDPATSTGFLIYDTNTDLFFRNVTVNFIPQNVNTSILRSDSIDLTSVSLDLLATESAASGLSNFSNCNGKLCVDASGGGSMRIAAVPEPTAMFLLGSGAALLFFGVRRFKRRPEA